MRRIRWYHAYFMLAIFNVVVIALTLRLHQQSVAWVENLLKSERDLEARVKWLQRTQDYLSELNAPGNNVFKALTPAEYDRQRRLFEIATANMNRTLDAAKTFNIDPASVANVSAEVLGMRAEAQQIFKVYLPLEAGPITEARQAELIMAAGPAMARMDAHQHRAIQLLGLISDRFNQSRMDLIRRYEQDIGSQFFSQSLVIAAILIILVGVFIFGRRLQAADRALLLERQRVKEMQRERLAAIGELCSSVAHGIRNPLASIRSSAQLALELGELDEDTRERIQDILDEGRRLGDRVTGLLSMARATADAFGPVDLASVVEVGVKGLLPEIERRGLAVELEVANEPVVVQGDRARLEQCVVELLSNAMEHSPEDGTILVRCQHEQNEAVIEIEDEGSGIPAPIRERVFDLFFTTKPTGTGIGLATVKRIARLHGGDATLADVTAGGARFVIRLPRTSTAAKLSLADDLAA